MKYSDEHYIKSIQEVASKVDGSLTRREYQELKENNHPDQSQFYRRFESWNTVKEMAGLGKNKSGGKLDADYDFFETLDTDEKLYWVGFLMVDGSVYQNGVGNMEMGIAINEVDHLRKLKNALNAEHKISLSDGKAYFRICDEKLTSDLRSHGVTSDKTLTDTIPDIEQSSNCASFVRGLFDADGSIYFGDKNSDWYISGSEGRLRKINKMLPVDAKLYNANTNKQHTKKLEVYSIGEIETLRNWMYPDFEHPRLERKFEKMDEVAYGVREDCHYEDQCSTSWN